MQEVAIKACQSAADQLSVYWGEGGASGGEKEQSHLKKGEFWSPPNTFLSRNYVQNAANC